MFGVAGVPFHRAVELRGIDAVLAVHGCGEEAALVGHAVALGSLGEGLGEVVVVEHLFHLRLGEHVAGCAGLAGTEETEQEQGQKVGKVLGVHDDCN